MSRALTLLAAVATGSAAAHLITGAATMFWLSVAVVMVCVIGADCARAVSK